MQSDRSLEQAEKVLRREVSSNGQLRFPTAPEPPSAPLDVHSAREILCEDNPRSFGRPGLASWHKQGFMMPEHLPERLLEARSG